MITLGSKGSIGWDGKNSYFQKSMNVKVIDTTGAGDVYHGAFIYGILNNWNLLKCMRFASVTSALKCREIGAQNGIPRLEEVMKSFKTFT